MLSEKEINLVFDTFRVRVCERSQFKVDESENNVSAVSSGIETT